MKIKSYKKLRKNIYQILFEDLRTSELYEDTILEFNLLLKKEISSKEWMEIQKSNKSYACYYEALHYLNYKNRFRKEIEEYLKKKNFEEKDIEVTLNKLEKQNYINEDRFLEAYIHDQIYLSSNGPRKIQKNLLELGIEEEKITSFLQAYPKEIWLTKLKKMVLKKIGNNHKDSVSRLKEKILTSCLHNGYEKEDILAVLQMVSIEKDNHLVQKEAEKLYKKLISKYKDKELFLQIKRKLLSKGFSFEEIENALVSIKKHYEDES